jgi:predicted ATPase/DNA-binding SARP family transcriptional activator
MEFRILGPLEVVDSLGSLLPIPAAKQRSLLVLLLIHNNEVQSKDRIMDALWGEDQPAGGYNTLRFHISKLRACLGSEPDRLATQPPGYLLRADDTEIDARRFEQSLAEAASIAGYDPLLAADGYREALALWRGPALVDVEYETFARTEIARLEELKLVGLEGRFEAELGAGRHDELIGELRSVVSDYPLRERLWAALMTALYRAGRQSDALRAYQEARGILGNELGIEPSEELRNLEDKVLLQDDSIRAPREQRRTGVVPAPVSSFVGRQHELSTIRKLLARGRLLTLTGVGGVGKSRLALELATQIADTYRDGVWYTDLAALDTADMVRLAFADSLGLRSRTAELGEADIVARLAAAEALLVVDNCEHLVEPTAALVAAVLAGCPTVSVLATSRELLGVPGEVAFSVPTMGAVDGMGANGAVTDAAELFVQRANAAVPGGEYAPAELERIQRLCVALDGLPLAIELAAARTRLLSLNQLEQRLDDRFALLAAGSRGAPLRQQTLEATVEWSYNLLGESEQRLFCVLSLFSGSFALEAAEAAGAALSDGPDILGLLGSLVDKSLIARTSDRFQMLPTLRHFAARKAGGLDLAVAKRNVIGVLTEIAKRAESELATPDWVDSAERLRLEHGNMRSALAWAIDAGDTDAALRMAGALALHWVRCGLWSEGQFWLKRAASAGTDAPATMQLRDGLRSLGGIDDPSAALEALANAARDDEPVRAVRLYGAVAAVREAGDGASAAESPEGAADLGELRNRLGDDIFAQAWRDGEAVVGMDAGREHSAG